jgi:hypothetical protein
MNRDGIAILFGMVYTANSESWLRKRSIAL